MLPASTQLLWEAILDAGIFHGFTKGFVNGVEGFCCFEHVVFYLHDSQDSLYLYIYISLLWENVCTCAMSNVIILYGWLIESNKNMLVPSEIWENFMIGMGVILSGDVFFEFLRWTQLVQDMLKNNEFPTSLDICWKSPPIESARWDSGNGMSGGRWDMVLSLLSEMLSRSTTPNEITLTTATWILEHWKKGGSSVV